MIVDYGRPAVPSGTPTPAAPLALPSPSLPMPPGIDLATALKLAALAGSLVYAAHVGYSHGVWPLGGQ